MRIITANNKLKVFLVFTYADILKKNGLKKPSIWPKKVFSPLKAYFVSQFCYHNNDESKKNSKFHTWTILLINQLDEIGEKQLSIFGSRGGQICPLMHVALSWASSFSIIISPMYTAERMEVPARQMVNKGDRMA